MHSKQFFKLLKLAVTKMDGIPYAEILKLIYVFFVSLDWYFSCPGLLYLITLCIIYTLARSPENCPPVIPGKRG